jgi:hypothetical protein
MRYKKFCSNGKIVDGLYNYLKHRCNPNKDYFHDLQVRVLDQRDYYIYKQAGLDLF